MALGAHTADVLRVVLRGAATLTAFGIFGGVVLGLGLTHLMRALLYQVEPNDPTTFTIVAALAAVVALVACYLPARRATKVNPTSP